MLYEQELAVGGGGELDVLVGVGAGAYGAEHLLAARTSLTGRWATLAAMAARTVWDQT